MDQADVAAVGAQRRAEPGGARPADEDWVRTLAGQGREHDRAVERLHALLLRACRAEVGRRAPRIGLTGRDVDDLAQEAAPDATVAVLAKLSTFRGESLFTTWAYAFAVFEVSAAIGRHLRRTVGVRLDDHA